MRGLRTELDIRSDSMGPPARVDQGRYFQRACNRRSTAFPAACGGCSVSGPTRNLAQRAASTRLEVEETAALIDFVAVCRTYASELAINEVTLRTYWDLQQYVEQTTEALVESLRRRMSTPRVPAATGRGGDPLL